MYRCRFATINSITYMYVTMPHYALHVYNYNVICYGIYYSMFINIQFILHGTSLVLYAIYNM